MVLAARLPPGVLRELAGFLPNCVKTARTLRADPAAPRRAKVAVGFAALWCLSPIDLIPEFLPVIGPLAAGFLGPLLITSGLSRTPAATASLLLNLELVATTLLAVLLFREHLGRRVIAVRGPW